MAKTVNLEETVGPVEASFIVKIAPEVIREACRNGELKGVNSQNRWFIKRADLDAWVKARQEAA